MSIMPCGECSSLFESRSSRHRFCSDKCRYAAKDKARGIPCAACGEQMMWQGKLVAGVSMHQSCKAEMHAKLHNATTYKNGCRCDACKSAVSARMRAYADSVREKHGAHPTTLLRRKFREENGYWRNQRGSDWIASKLRLEIYERDGWECYLCSLPIDRESHWNDNFAPSLDHLVPRSAGGSHNAENLKTAHRVCNSLKGATHVLV